MTVELFRRPLVTGLCVALLLSLAAGGATAATEFAVTNTNDSGPGSLRQAILDANAFINSLHDNTVVFAIPGSGVHSIRPLSPLPPIKDLLIDGYTQPGSQPNSLESGSDAVLTIELDGSAAGASADGLVNLGAAQGTGVPNVTIRGLVINRFSGRGIHVTGPGGNGFPGFVTVQGCYIGTDPSGTQALGNGIGIELGTDAQAVIGEQTPTLGGNTTPFPAKRNLISGNLGAGIKIDSADPTSPAFATLRGAYVGADASGTMALGNGGDGVQIGPEGGVGSQGLGSFIYLYDNVIAANGGDGIDTQGIGTQAANNRIGLGINGGPLGNVGHGAHFHGDASGTLTAMFGQLAVPGPGVANNGGAGVLIEDSAIVDTSGPFTNNGGLGVDLAPTGPNLNDSGDSDGGPNEGLNFPVITSAVAQTTSPSSRIQGTINSAPNSQIQVLLFLNTVCDPSGFGESARFVDSTTVTTGADGNATFDRQLSFSIDAAASPFVVAQSRRFAENPPLASALEVSEFSACFPISGTTPVPVPLPALSISDVSVTEGNTGTVTANFIVSLSAAASGTVSVNYSTANATATGGSDYVADNGTLTFGAGEMTKTVAITINGDTDVEADETFLVDLAAPGGATIADAQGQGTIVNDDVAVPPTDPPTVPPELPTLSIDNVSVQEGGEARTVPAVFTVTLSAPSSTPVTVVVSTLDSAGNREGTAVDNGSRDYGRHTETLTFSPGQTSLPFVVTIYNDRDIERPRVETFIVFLRDASGATILRGRGGGRIVDDDEPSGGGGGALDAWLLAALLGVLLFARRELVGKWWVLRGSG
jgi:hypothetical protein